VIDVANETLTAEQEKRFEKLVRGLNELLVEIRKTHPEANYYLQEDTLHVMSGPSHDARDRAQQDCIMASIIVPNAGGGGW
jgi:hypothetical protein